ncbi:MAG TPA: hypothetical protein VL125_12415 [Pelobium sp.]|nr:hypothetical protein [Pelobium sp.]
MKKILLLAFTASVMLGACKKSDDTPKEEVCTTVSSYSTSYDYSPDTHVKNISYDSQNRISKVTWSNSSLTYTYSASSITEDVNDGGYLEQTVYTLDDKNRIVREVRGTDVDISYFYDAEGHLSEVNDGSETTTFEWQNGNLVECDGTTYSYYNEVAPQSYLITTYGVNGIYLNSSLYSYFGKMSKNLLKTETEGQSTTTYQYEKDTKGRVNKITSINGGDKDTYAISYSCD